MRDLICFLLGLKQLEGVCEPDENVFGLRGGVLVRVVLEGHSLVCAADLLGAGIEWDAEEAAGGSLGLVVRAAKGAGLRPSAGGLAQWEALLLLPLPLLAPPLLLHPLRVHRVLARRVAAEAAKKHHLRIQRIRLAKNDFEARTVVCFGAGSTLDLGDEVEGGFSDVLAAGFGLPEPLDGLADAAAALGLRLPQPAGFGPRHVLLLPLQNGVDAEALGQLLLSLVGLARAPALGAELPRRQRGPLQSSLHQVVSAFRDGPLEETLRGRAAWKGGLEGGAGGVLLAGCAHDSEPVPLERLLVDRFHALRDVGDVQDRIHATGQPRHRLCRCFVKRPLLAEGRLDDVPIQITEILHPLPFVLEVEPPLLIVTQAAAAAILNPLFFFLFPFVVAKGVPNILKDPASIRLFIPIVLRGVFARHILVPLISMLLLLRCILLGLEAFVIFNRNRNRLRTFAI
mmetsp:Transcript_15068/g.38221  ORF Transcript_15068/g.38221 Transcript_15068/m.38221 type:complete len:456 (-) Transcript_15068:570-1937(-)